MDDFNKVISFILGLVVVIVFLAVVSKKYDFSKKLLPLSIKSKSKKIITPTPIQTISIKNKTGKKENKQDDTYQAKKTNTIPETGAPIFLLPLAFSGIFSGFYLKKKGDSIN